MRPTKWADGVEKIDGKMYQKVYMQSSNWYARCPYCCEDMDDLRLDNQIVKCDRCGKEFFAEFDSQKLL